MNNLQANICLIAVTVCWSCEIILLSLLPEGVNPFATTCTTSIIGAVLLGICFFRRIIAAFRQDRSRLVRHIVFLSILNASYNVLIEMGLEYFDVSSAAFTLSMAVVILPVMLFVTKSGVPFRTIIAAILVMAGIVVAVGPVFFSIPPTGFVFMLTSCIIHALFIIKLSEYARQHDPVALATGISAVNTVVTFIPWCVMQPLTFTALPWSSRLIAIFVIYGYFIVAFTTVLNTFAQRRASPAQATVIFATEIVFTIIWAVFLPETLVDHVVITPHVVIGCVLIVFGNVVQIVPMPHLRKWLIKRLGHDYKSPDDDAAVRPITIAWRSSTADAFTGVVGRFKSSASRKVIVFFALLAVYLVISLPFKVLGIIPGFSDIRPVCMLQPVYGIFFGIPGCLAFGIGNVISDILSDSLRWTSIAGFIGNFVYPFCMYLFWTRLRKAPFHLRTWKRVFGMIASILICACIETLIIAPAVAIVYPEVDIMLFTISCLANTSLFSIGFAIPFIILIQDELGFVPLGAARTEWSLDELGGRSK